MLTVHEEISASVLEARARRAARRTGYKAIKSRRSRSLNNLGGFALLDADRNLLVCGSNFELSAQDVIEICSEGDA